MYKIIKDGAVIVTVNTPTWVKLQDNSYFGLCSEKEAQGIVVDGNVYSISGKTELDGKEAVILCNVSEISYQLELKKENSMTANYVVDLDFRLSMVELGL